jgi:REP element-mobilizing transposase RayT
MPRQPRLEYPGALYHVTARGVQKSAIYLDDLDRACFLGLIGRALSSCDARAFAFCMMGNHYHLVLQTAAPNLSTLMRRINSAYSLAFNRRHGRSGHVFEGRFHAVHVDRDAYLLEVCRYVDLNPVRAGLRESPLHWRWSSYRSHVGIVAAPPWLATSELHGVLMGNEPRDAAEIDAASRRYAAWVEAGRDVRLWERSLLEGRFLGDRAFARRAEAIARQ